MPDLKKLGAGVADPQAIILIEGKNASRKVQTCSHVLFQNGRVTHLLENAHGLHMRTDITPVWTSDYRGFDLVKVDNLP